MLSDVKICWRGETIPGIGFNSRGNHGETRCSYRGPVKLPRIPWPLHNGGSNRRCYNESREEAATAATDLQATADTSWPLSLSLSLSLFFCSSLFQEKKKSCLSLTFAIRPPHAMSPPGRVGSDETLHLWPDSSKRRTTDPEVLFLCVCWWVCQRCDPINGTHENPTDQQQ